MIKVNKFKSAEQYKYWNENQVKHWIDYDEEINFKFSEITKILFKKVNINPSNYILDVGCGSGFTSKICSSKVGNKGKVLGIDISLPLLKLFKKKYKRIKNIKCKHADIETFTLKPNTFDLVISRFGVMFFENPNIAFSNIYKSLRRNGFFTFVCWTDFNYNQLFSLPVEAVTLISGIKKPRLTRKAGPFSFNNINYLKKTLKNSKFKNIKIKKIKTFLPIKNIESDVNIFTSIGPAAKIVREHEFKKEKEKQIKKLTYNLFYNKVYKKNKKFKAKIFLVTAAK